MLKNRPESKAYCLSQNGFYVFMCVYVCVFMYVFVCMCVYVLCVWGGSTFFQKRAAGR